MCTCSCSIYWCIGEIMCGSVYFKLDSALVEPLKYVKSQSQNYLSYLTTDRQSASYRGVRPPSGTRDQFFSSFSLKLSLDSWEFLIMGRPLWREDESIIYSCCWASPAQSLSGPSSAELMTISIVSNLRHIYLEGKLPGFISPINRVAQLYPQV
jgi:hypothetical protein